MSEKMTLVRININTPCEYPACDQSAEFGFLGHVSGRLGKCYCHGHTPVERQEKMINLLESVQCLKNQ